MDNGLLLLVSLYGIVVIGLVAALLVMSRAWQQWRRRKRKP